MYAAAQGADIIIAVGNYSYDVIRGGIQGEIDKSSLYAFPSTEAAAEFLQGIIKAGDAVLIKGSRGIKMEYIVDYLRERG